MKIRPSLLLGIGAIFFGSIQGCSWEPEITHGPIVGAVTPNEARVWVRFDRSGDYQLNYYPVKSKGRGTTKVRVDNTTDLCGVFHLTDLRPGQAYRYDIEFPSGGHTDGRAFRFETPLPGAVGQTVRLAFGSCANVRRFPNQPIWDRIHEADPDAVVLLGDTPYIDSTDLKKQRERYREFYTVPEFFKRSPSTTLYATWDDHDFGADDSDGNLPGKENARRAFIEYHANPSYGDGKGGVYTRFRRGPVEVFLLDTRWFAETAPSPVDADKPTLLGKTQFEWLKEGLVASTAPIKILASGMVWNGAVREGKRDHWETYVHERDALFRFLGERQIDGVVLVSGDLHRSRVYRHPTRDTVGYDLFEFTTSPLANTIHNPIYDPPEELMFNVGVEQSFLLMTADAEEGTLASTFYDAEGKELYSLALGVEEDLGESTKPN